MIGVATLNSLENFDAETYFTSLLSIAKADGRLDETEMEFIEDQAKMMGFDIKAILENEKLTENIDFSKISSLTKNILLRDCISLAHIDGTYDGAEKQRIQDLGKRMGIAPERISNIEKWLLDYWDLMERGQEIMAG